MDVLEHTSCNSASWSARQGRVATRIAYEYLDKPPNVQDIRTRAASMVVNIPVSSQTLCEYSRNLPQIAGRNDKG